MSQLSLLRPGTPSGVVNLCTLVIGRKHCVQSIWSVIQWSNFPDCGTVCYDQGNGNTSSFWTTWNLQCTCMRGWCSLSLSLFSWILQKIVFLVGVGDAIRNTQWYAMHILFCIVEGLTRMLQVSLLRLWILCLGSGLWSPILSCWPCTLVIVRKCTL